MDRQAQLDWLVTRMTDERGQHDFRQLIESIWEEQRVAPLESLIPPGPLKALFHEHLEAAWLKAIVKPLTTAFLTWRVEALRKDDRAVGRWISDDAQRRLLAIVSRPGFVHEDWVRATLKEKAVEDVLTDAIYRAVRDFSTIVPRLILRVLPTGRFAKLGGAAALGTRIAEELEKILEPEIKRFTSQGSQKALDRAADFAVTHIDDPSSVAFRRNAIRFMLEKSPRFHISPIDESMIDELSKLSDETVEHMRSFDETREQMDGMIDELHTLWGHRSIADIETALGTRFEPPFDAVAAASWPMVRGAASSQAARLWFQSVLDELPQKTLDHSSS